MSGITNIATKAAREAGNIIIQGFNRLDYINVFEKNHNDFVSDIDKKAEDTIIDIVKTNFPDHGIIGEETGSLEGNEYTWIIDPLDGTRNFIHGVPHFAISIAVKFRDNIEHGIIFDPFKNELFTAVRGSGAQLNDRRMRVSKVNKLQNAIIGTAFPRATDQDLDIYLKQYQYLYKLSSGIRHFGSSALDLAYVAAGRLDAIWSYNLNIWDMAAGALLIQEAGGITTEPTGADNYLESGNISAGNIKIHHQLVEFLNKNM